jgi:protein-S-isoprenylcysteine O-methyltransferase Ste14
MNNILHWLIVIVTALVKLAVCSLCILSGQLLAVLYAVSELLCMSFGLWNALAKKDFDRSFSGLLVPAMYWLSSVVIPTHAAPGLGLSVLLALLIAAQIGSYLYLGKAYTMGVSTWTGLVATGPYRVIRHPQLALQLLRRFVFVLGYPCPWNFFSGCFFVAAVVTVILIEERYLSGFVEYNRYALSVPWRLLPRIW